MNNQRKFLLGATAVGVLSVFLPWATILGFSVSGINGDGIVVLPLMATALILTIVGNRTNALGKKSKIATIALGVLTALIALMNINNFSAIGIYLTLMAGIATAVLPFLKLENKLA